LRSASKRKEYIMSPEVEVKKESSAVVYRNRWMTVREDRIVRSDGSPGIYGVVEKRDFAVVAAIDDGRIHLVEQYRYPVGARYWEMPQGAWEEVQADPLELAAAELREETGLVAASMVHVGRLFEAYGFATQAFNVFLATKLTQGETDREPEEIGMVARSFPLAEFEAMIASGLVMDAATVAAFGLFKIKGLL
jgi:ADP-ribose pyrophosphatase